MVASAGAIRPSGGTQVLTSEPVCGKQVGTALGLSSLSNRRCTQAYAFVGYPPGLSNAGLAVSEAIRPAARSTAACVRRRSNLC